MALLDWLSMFPKADPNTQAKTMMVASFGRTPKNVMRITTLGPPPPSPANELSPDINIIVRIPMIWDPLKDNYIKVDKCNIDPFPRNSASQ